MTGRTPKIALLGATGAVGRAVLELLEEGAFPAAELRLLASERSREERIDFRGEELVVEAPGERSFRGVDVAVLAAGEEASRTWAPRARAEGVPVVDLSAAFRADPDVPLVVAGVNDAAAREAGKGIVAGACGAAVPLALALAPIHRAAGVERASVTVLVPASAAGREGTRQLEAEVLALLNGEEPEPAAFTHRMAFNVVPQIGSFGPDGATAEERAVQADLRRVLSAPGLRATATAVRVPVFHGTAAAVNLRTGRRLGAAEARELLRSAPGVKVVDAPAERVYPMPMLSAHDESALVGRIREDPTQENGLDLFVVGDNLRLGGAANALAIVRILTGERGS
jgi:aspartate-semialdehyde dehydrogenase